MALAAKIAPLALILSAPFAAFPAAACSVFPGYRVPTTLELFERADTILIGTVTGKTRGQDDYVREVLIRPETLLKGPALPREASVRGMIAPRGQAPSISDPRELRRANPESFSGSCLRFRYRKGQRLLVFFARKDGALRFADYPFARSVEDVASSKSLWPQAVRLYVEVAALPEGERRAALEAKRDTLRARTRDKDAQALARDIDVELAADKRQPVLG